MKTPFLRPFLHLSKLIEQFLEIRCVYSAIVEEIYAGILTIGILIYYSPARKLMNLIFNSGPQTPEEYEEEEARRFEAAKKLTEIENERR